MENFCDFVRFCAIWGLFGGAGLLLGFFSCVILWDSGGFARGFSWLCVWAFGSALLCVCGLCVGCSALLGFGFCRCHAGLGAGLGAYG